jgi:hypothetical protein
MGDYRNNAADRVGAIRRDQEKACAERTVCDYPDAPRPARDMPEYLARHGRAMPGPPADYAGEATHASTMDHIIAQIRRATTAATEIGHKLHDHANALYGHVPVDEEFCGLGNSKVSPADLPAIERLYQALNELDRAQGYMAQGAGRNTTLA